MRKLVGISKSRPAQNRKKHSFNFVNLLRTSYCSRRDFCLESYISLYRNASVSLAPAPPPTRCWLNTPSSRLCWDFSFSLYGNEYTISTWGIGYLYLCIKYTNRDHRLEIGKFFKVSSFQGQYLERTATSILTSQATTPSPAGLGTSWKTSLALVLSGLYLCGKFLK